MAQSLCSPSPSFLSMSLLSMEWGPLMFLLSLSFLWLWGQLASSCPCSAQLPDPQSYSSGEVVIFLYEPRNTPLLLHTDHYGNRIDQDGCSIRTSDTGGGLQKEVEAFAHQCEFAASVGLFLKSDKIFHNKKAFKGSFPVYISLCVFGCVCVYLSFSLSMW